MNCRFLCLLAALFVSIGVGSAQTVGNTPSTFTLTGNINADTGAILLSPVGDDTAFYPTYPAPSEVPVSKGRFSFSGALPYTYGFKLSYRRGQTVQYISDVFMLGPGPQSIFCRLGTVREIPAIGNAPMRELRMEYLRAAGPVTASLDSIQEVRRTLRRSYGGHVPDSVTTALAGQRATLLNKKDSALLNYTRSHPNSYVALWELVGEWSTGYRPAMDAIFAQFSEAIRQSYTGQELSKRLKAH